MTGATNGAGNAHSFWNTWFHSLWGVHDFTHSLYIHHILLNLSVLRINVYGLMTGLFAWISLTALSRTYFIKRLFLDVIFEFCRRFVWRVVGFRSRTSWYPFDYTQLIIDLSAFTIDHTLVTIREMEQVQVYPSKQIRSEREIEIYMHIYIERERE